MKCILKLCVVLCVGVLFTSFYSLCADSQLKIRKEEPVRVFPGSDGTGVAVDPYFGQVPLYFIPNKGQFDVIAKYYTKTSHYTLWITEDGLVYDTIRMIANEDEATHVAVHSYKTERGVSGLIFLNANKHPGIIPLEITQHRVNYIMGNNPDEWQTGISTSRIVLYKEIYKNIDLKIYGNERQIEYDWIVRPGGNPADIRIKYENVMNSTIDKNGNLVIKTRMGELIHKKPVSYQLRDGEKVEVNSYFEPISENIYGFRVREYDDNYELIIDPIVSVQYSSYLGGSGGDEGYGIKVDSNNSVYIGGYTVSYDFPTKDSNYGPRPGCDIFVTKFAPDGKELVYSTYLSGDGCEICYDIDLSAKNEVYLTGYSNSTNFPASNSSSGYSDVIVCILNSDGTLKDSRYLGGSGFDTGYAIAVDCAGNAYITGEAGGSDFPTTTNAYKDTFRGGFTDAVVAKLSADGLELDYSTFLGGNGYEFGFDIAVDQSCSFYVFGITDSKNFPLKNQFQNASGGWSDNFIVKFKPDGSDLVYSTYLGGAGEERLGSLVVDDSGYTYVSGYTSSTDFPTKNAYKDTLVGKSDIYVCKFSQDGSSLEFSTYLGGAWTTHNGLWNDIVLDDSGDVYVATATRNTNFPTRNPYQDEIAGGLDAIVCKLSADGSSVIYATYLGGSEDDRANAIALDNSGNVYITGTTFSSDFPMVNPFQDYYAGANDRYHGDVIISKLSYTYDLTVQSTPETGVPIGVMPDDCNGNGDGETNFIRSYEPGTVVTLSAPETFQDKVFRRWTIDGNSVFVRSIQVIMDSSQTVEAVYQTPGVLSLSHSRLFFGANNSGAVTGEQTFLIDKSGESDLNWTVSDNASWCSCSPVIGTDAGMVTVSVNATGLTAGTYIGTITVSDAIATNSPLYVTVTLVVYGANKTGVPFGYFETPKEGAHVYSSIPVTGWTLDDIEVENVKIYREQGKQLVYIGDAVFVEGARPDVELAYSTYPKSYRAGWGYMMLTNFLPDGGNGTFKLYAIARDLEGHQVTLGTKTIHCDNANAVKPFGAIDTPGQGGTASGSNFRNQGWVLTPRPHKIPEDGHTIFVWIDGVNIGNPIYNIYRSDIASLFPGYENSNGAMAYFDFDTTAYKNGVHTIQWTAMDNAGNVDGIGSRYFSIRNNGGSTGGMSMAQRTERVELNAVAFNVPPSILKRNISEIPLDYIKPVRVKTGYDRHIKPHQRFPDETGKITIEIKELERVEIDLGGSANWWGFQLVGDQLRNLPIGSFLDSQSGIFCWQPGPGHIGRYRLVFIEKKSNNEIRKKFATVNILSKF